jgi:hypothetical protein
MMISTVSVQTVALNSPLTVGSSKSSALRERTSAFVKPEKAILTHLWAVRVYKENPMSDVKKYMEQMVEIMRPHSNNGFKYINIPHFVLELGRPMGDMKPFPKNLTKGKKKECFRNAMLLAIEKNWTYCEGYALAVIPTHHAWVLDDDGDVIDPTWDEGVDYYGVEIPMSYALPKVFGRGYYGIIDDPQNRFPLLRGEETLED